MAKINRVIVNCHLSLVTLQELIQFIERSRDNPTLTRNDNYDY